MGIRSAISSFGRAIKEAVTGPFATNLKDAFKGIAGLVLGLLVCAAVCSAICGFALRIAFPEAMIITQPMEFAGKPFEDVGLTSKSATDIVTDEWNTDCYKAIAFQGYTAHDSSSSAGGQPSSAGGSSGKTQDSAGQAHYGAVRTLFKIPVQTSYGIEIKGVSVDTIFRIYDRIRYRIWDVSGDLSGDKDHPAVSLRLNKNSQQREWYVPWNGKASNEAVIDLLRNATDQVLAATDPETMVRADLEEKKYTLAEQVARNWVQTDTEASDPYYFLLLTRLYEWLDCFPPDSSNPCTYEQAGSNLSAALALAQWERSRVGGEGFWGWLKRWRNPEIAYHDQDRFDDLIADIELSICNSDPSPCDSRLLPDAQARYEELQRKYGKDSFLAENQAAVEILENKRDDAVRTLQDFAARGKTDPNFYFHLGTVLEAASQADGAIDAYHRAVMGDPNLLKARAALMGLLVDRGRTSDLDEVLDDYRSLSLIDPASLDSAARDVSDMKLSYFNALWKMGDLEEAGKALLVSIKPVSSGTVKQFAEDLEKTDADLALQIVEMKIKVGDLSADPRKMLTQEAMAIRRVRDESAKKKKGAQPTGDPHRQYLYPVAAAKEPSHHA